MVVSSILTRPTIFAISLLSVARHVAPRRLERRHADRHDGKADTILRWRDEMADDILLFALKTSRAFGAQVSRSLGIDLADLEERDFEDGEHKTRPLVNVRDRSVFVVQSLYADDAASVNDKLVKLLFFIGACKDASAASVTAVVPYLCYARKDRKTKLRDPVSTRYIAQLFEAVGTDGVITIDVHNLAAFQNSFRCRTDHLQAMPLFVDYFSTELRGEEIAVISPDVGGAKRAEQFRQALGRTLNTDVTSAFVEKHRSGGKVTGSAFGGDVTGRVCIIVDDLIASGGTLLRAAEACRKGGASRVMACATHGNFVGKANDVLADDMIERFVITDTVPPFRITPEIASRKLVVLDAASLFGQAIDRIRTGKSIEEMFEI
jgi:ribose-phosphate pyrophosphokinase